MSMLRRGALVIGVLVGIALVVSSAVPAFAGGRVFFGVGLGFPFSYPYPYPYPYAYPTYAPPVVVQTAPPVYVQPEPQPSQPQYWYYCPNSQTYYPYVKDCPAGWLQVVPQASPPPAAPR